MREDFSGQRIHFIGVGGVSMSALAKLALAFGASVSGSDISDGDWFAELSASGAEVYHGHDTRLACAADIVVYTSAISEQDEELVAARLSGIPTLTRHSFLARAAEFFKCCVAVGGTHGKTTATALISHIFKVAGTRFCAHVGGVPVGGNNLTYCGNDYFITEACEYKRAFCELRPDIAVVLNLESDHPDCYKTEAELVSAFQCFCDNISRGGTLVLNGDTALPKLHISEYTDIITFGYEHTNTCHAVNIVEQNGLYSYDIIYADRCIGRVNGTLFGNHNILNVLASAAVCIASSIDSKAIVEGINTFRGVERRYERRFLKNGGEVVFDYAHHPSEIKAVIATARARTSNKLRVYFQPHTFSRTAAYFEKFCQVLSEADWLGLVCTYPAREDKTAGLSALDLYSALSVSRQVTYFDELLGVSRHILRHTNFGDTALILGAGDIYNISPLLF